MVLLEPVEYKSVCHSRRFVESPVFSRWLCLGRQISTSDRPCRSIFVSISSLFECRKISNGSKERCLETHRSTPWPAEPVEASPLGPEVLLEQCRWFEPTRAYPGLGPVGVDQIAPPAPPPRCDHGSPADAVVPFVPGTSVLGSTSRYPFPTLSRAVLVRSAPPAQSRPTQA